MCSAQKWMLPRPTRTCMYMYLCIEFSFKHFVLYIQLYLICAFISIKAAFSFIPVFISFLYSFSCHVSFLYSCHSCIHFHASIHFHSCIHFHLFFIFISTFMIIPAFIYFPAFIFIHELILFTSNHHLLV